MVLSESDFLPYCVVSDLAAFQIPVIEELTAVLHVDTFRTELTTRQIKDEGLADIYVP